MSSPLAPVFANIFMDFHESKWLNEYNFNKPKFNLTLISINWVPGDLRSIFLVTSFTRKMPESSDSMYSSIFMLENT